MGRIQGLAWVLAPRIRQPSAGGGSSFSIALMCITIRRISANASTNQGPANRRLDPTLAAVGTVLLTPPVKARLEDMGLVAKGVTHPLPEP